MKVYMNMTGSTEINTHAKCNRYSVSYRKAISVRNLETIIVLKHGNALCIFFSAFTVSSELERSVCAAASPTKS
jgi:hypothetical protein